MLINGIEITLQKSISLQDFLEQNGYQIHRVAVERNGDIVPKAEYSTTILQPNDKLEVVSFMGGG